MNRTDCESKSKLFEGEHFRVAKSLRENGITRIKISEPHFKISDSGKVADATFFFFPVSGFRYLKSREPDVFPRIHLEIEGKRICYVRLDHFLHEFHMDRVLAKNLVPVHRLE